jgi:Flp pilus assembly protein TadB
MNFVKSILDQFKALKPSEVKKKKYEALRMLLILMTIILAVTFAITSFIFALPIAPIFLVSALTLLIPTIFMFDFVNNQMNSLSKSLFGKYAPFLTELDLNDEIAQIVDNKGDIKRKIKMKDFLRELTDFPDGEQNEANGISLDFKNILLNKNKDKEDIQKTIEELLNKFLENELNGDNKLHHEKLSLNSENKKNEENEEKKNEIKEKILKYIDKYLKKANRANFTKDDFADNGSGSKLSKFIDQSIKNEKIKSRFFASSLLITPLIGLAVAFFPLIIGASIGAGASFAIFGAASLLIMGLFQINAKRIEDKTNSIPTKLDLSEVKDIKVGKNKGVDL